MIVRVAATPSRSSSMMCAATCDSASLGPTSVGLPLSNVASGISIGSPRNRGGAALINHRGGGGGAAVESTGTGAGAAVVVAGTDATLVAPSAQPADTADRSSNPSGRATRVDL